MWTLQIEHRDISFPSLDTVLNHLDGLAHGDDTGGLALTDDDGNSLLIVSFDTRRRLGYFVNVRERDECAEQILVDHSLGDERVIGAIGEQDDERPRFVFVNRDLARRATRTFFETGRRDRSLTWLPYSEAT